VHIQLPARVNKKVLLIAAAAVLVGVGAFGTWWLLRPNPADKLYNAQAKDETFNRVIIEEVHTKGTTAKLTGIVKKDGTYKVDGMVHCTGHLPGVGSLNLTVGIRQVGTQMFAHYIDMHVSNALDSEAQARVADFFGRTLKDKWVIAEDGEVMATALKKYGMIFGTTGIASAKFTTAQTADFMREEKLFKVLGAKAVTESGKPATEYSVQVNRTDYVAVLDHLQTNFEYKDQVVDQIFDGHDTLKAKIILDNATGHAIATIDDVSNPCVSFMGSVDPSAAGDMPERLLMRTTLAAGTDVPSATKPTSYLTLAQMYQLLSEQLQP
jgi:hypothetical protein